MLELYYFPTATCGYKARLTLAEKGVEFVHRVLGISWVRFFDDLRCGSVRKWAILVLKLE